MPENTATKPFIFAKVACDSATLLSLRDLELLWMISQYHPQFLYEFVVPLDWAKCENLHVKMYIFCLDACKNATNIGIKISKNTFNVMVRKNSSLPSVTHKRDKHLLCFSLRCNHYLAMRWGPRSCLLWFPEVNPEVKVFKLSSLWGCLVLLDLHCNSFSIIIGYLQY